MKTIYKLSTVLFITCVVLSCTKKKDNSPFCVTYKVSVRFPKPYKVLIIYKDSSEFKAVDADIGIDGNWSQQVCLSPDDLASLTVMPHYQNNIHLDDASYWILFNNFKAFITGEIIHKNKTVSNAGTEAIRVNLYGAEI